MKFQLTKIALIVVSLLSMAAAFYISITIISGDNLLCFIGILCAVTTSVVCAGRAFEVF